MWDADSTEVKYILPGHEGAVTAVSASPKEYVVATGSTDKKIFLGELIPV